MMGYIMCVLLIGTNNSEVMCGLRQYAHYRLKVNQKSKTHQEPTVRKWTILVIMYKDLRYLNEECSAEKNAADKKAIRGCPRLEMLCKMRSVADSHQCRRHDAYSWQYESW